MNKLKLPKGWKITIRKEKVSFSSIKTMNWYKKANNNIPWQEEVNSFLNELNILHSIDTGLIKVNRDSIVNKITQKDEHASYRELISILNNKFQSRFIYVLKNDDNFWIEKIK